MKNYLVQVTVMVDDDEVSDQKETEIRRAVESLNSSIGVFIVESVSESESESE